MLYNKLVTEYFCKKLYMIGFVTKLGFEKPKIVFKNLNEGAKISKNYFYSCHIYNSGLEETCY